MTGEDFRRLALLFPEAEEKSHFGQADFRVRNKIFATVKDATTGVVKLLREQQDMMTAAEPQMFQPIKGGWGNQGWTRVDLSRADQAAVRSALAMAWRNVAPKSLQLQQPGDKFLV